MLMSILKFICYGFMGFLLVIGILVFGQFFTDIMTIVYILGGFVCYRIIVWAIQYRQRHPYQPMFSKGEWSMIWFICLYKILTGKRR